MSRDVAYSPDDVCDNCGKAGAFDFMGDCYCDDCLKTCERCEYLFVIDPNLPKDEQKLCGDCTE